MFISKRWMCFLQKRCYQSTTAIRNEFIKFFEERDHIHVPSSSVLPNDDDQTLLFVNSGMNQFKSTILGKSEEKSSLKRVVNYQKCIRIAGKHNDLEDVGHDLHHQTFFEMLGNWAFNGAYDKKTACEYAWEFLVDKMHLNPDRLYISYFGGDKKLGLESDEECRKIWKNIGVSSNRILPFSTENFWEMGKVGPCGPCTEIHYDRIGDRNASHLVNRENSVVEIWNLVFMMYRRNPNGSLSDLSSFHIDTGMGLERLASAVQNVSSNYDIDIFAPIIEHIKTLSDTAKFSNNLIAQRVIADHLRAFTIAFSDGVQPGHTDAGRQIRMLLRRAFRNAAQMGIKQGKLEEIIPIIVNSLKEAYPNLATQTEWIQYSLSEEEKWYWEIMKTGRKKFDEAISKLPKVTRVIPGALMMKLKSQGVSPDLCQEFAEKEGLILDKDEFTRLLDAEKEIGRDPRFLTKLNVSIDEFPTHSDSCKYNLDEEIETKILGVFDKFGDRIKTLNGEGYVLLESCQFFAQEGGQAADQGLIKLLDDGASFEVLDCLKVNGVSILKGNVKEGKLCLMSIVQQCVDKERRAALMRAHSATHLLNWALQKTGVGRGQLGSGVYPDRLRFEYAPGECASEEDSVFVVESLVKDSIKNPKKLHFEEVDIHTAKEMTHLQSEFREGKVYPPKVRIVSVLEAKNEKPIAGETCCGTHVSSTGDIYDFTILSDFSIGKGARKIVAVTGEKVNEARKVTTLYRERLNDLIAKGANSSELDKFVKALPTDEMPYLDLRAIRLSVRDAVKSIKEEAKKRRKIKK